MDVPPPPRPEAPDPPGSSGATGQGGPELGEEITRLLQAAGAGSRAAADRLLPLLYSELRRLAQGLLRHERGDHTLQATALVHEAYVRLVGQRSVGFHDRAEFFRAAATAMRRVLVDHARTRGRRKRGGDARRTSLDDLVAELEHRSADLVALDEALEELSEIDATKARLVELRFFAGLSVNETAEVLGLSVRTAERHWTLARAWLHDALSAEGGA